MKHIIRHEPCLREPVILPDGTHGTVTHRKICGEDCYGYRVETVDGVCRTLLPDEFGDAVMRIPGLYADTNVVPFPARLRVVSSC